MVLAEDCIRLQAFTLPRRGARKLAPGVGVLCYPGKLAVVVGGASPFAQAIERRRLAHRYKVKCPTCGRWVRVLYLPPRGRRFLCRRCAGVTRWACWQRNGRYRQPKRPEAWLKWFLRRAAKAISTERG